MQEGKYPRPGFIYHQETNLPTYFPSLFLNIQCSLGNKQGNSTERKNPIIFEQNQFTHFYQKICRGVYQCPKLKDGIRCNELFHLNSKKQRRKCTSHHEQMMKVNCGTKFYFLQTKDFLHHMVYINQEHNHSKPPDFKLFNETKNVITNLTHENPTITTNQISQNERMRKYQDHAAANKDRIHSIKKKSLIQIFGTGPCFNRILNCVNGIELQESNSENHCLSMKRSEWNVPYMRFNVMNDDMAII